MAETIAALKSVSKKYVDGYDTVNALTDVNLEFKSGEFYGIWGPSGSGKSTLLSLLALLDTPTTGEVFVMGVDLKNASLSTRTNIRRTSIGVVFQFFHLLPTLSALENIAFSLILNGWNRKEALVEAEKCIEKIGLLNRKNNMPNELSGGEMQRVAVLRALIHKPKLVLADEPTGNLDANSEKLVHEMFQSYISPNTTMIMATHSDRAIKLCSKVIELNHGKT